MTLAYYTLGSEVFTASSDTNFRAKVLLCKAEVARTSQFDLEKSFASLLLRHANKLQGAELALTLSHIVLHSMKVCSRQAQPYCRSAALCLPCAPSLWMPLSAAPYVSYVLVCKRRFQMALSVNCEAGSLLLAISDKRSHAFEIHRQSVNALRLAMGNFHALPPAETASRHEEHITASDKCERLLLLARAHIKADPSPMLYPMNLLSLALRCLAIAEERNLGQSRTEALLLVARTRYEMRDSVTALQMLDDLQVDIASAPAKVKGEALILKAEILLDLAAKVEGECSYMLRHAADHLDTAMIELQQVEDYDNVQFCAYLLARIFHQLDLPERRNQYARICRYGLPKQGPCQTEGGIVLTRAEMPPGLSRLNTQEFLGFGTSGSFYPLSVVAAS